MDMDDAGARDAPTDRVRVEEPYRLIADPAQAPHWWPRRPADPRHSAAWASGSRRGGTERFLGAESGPALWVRLLDSPNPPRRMDAVAVCAGRPAGLPADEQIERAAAMACGTQFVLAANGYCSPLISAEPTVDGKQLRELVSCALAAARSVDAVPVALHCPPGDPLLAALAEFGFVFGQTDLYAVLEPVGDGLDDFLAAQSRRRRKTIREEMGALAQRGAGSVLTGAQAAPSIRVAARLVASAYAQRGQHIAPEEVEGVYRGLLAGHGDDFLLALVEYEGETVASTCLLQGGDALLGYSAGLRHPETRHVAGYFNAAYYAPLRHAYEHGLSRILLGPGNRETKRLRGARFLPLVSAVPADCAPLVELLRETDLRTRVQLSEYEEHAPA